MIKKIGYTPFIPFLLYAILGLILDVNTTGMVCLILAGIILGISYYYILNYISMQTNETKDQVAWRLFKDMLRFK